MTYRESRLFRNVACDGQYFRHRDGLGVAHHPDRVIEEESDHTVPELALGRHCDGFDGRAWPELESGVSPPLTEFVSREGGGNKLSHGCSMNPRGTG